MPQQTDGMDAMLTEYLPATAILEGPLDAPAKVTAVKDGRGIWVHDTGRELTRDPGEYRVECSCGEAFGNWGAATKHAEDQHGGKE